MATDSHQARICCLDLDTFFVSVERLKRPELIGKPVVVGALPGRRGVVTAASYEVREFGVRSGMPISEAYRRAPHATYLSGEHGEYGKYSALVKKILMQFSPEVRAASIDEFFLDFRGCETLYRTAADDDDDLTVRRTVSNMRQTIQDELGLPASVGIAASRPIAKVASGSAKPAGVLMVRIGDEYSFLADLPVRRWPGIGPVAEQRLSKQGIHTLGQLMDSKLTLAESIRKLVLGHTAAPLSRDRPAFQEHDPRGLTLGIISNESTFQADVGHKQLVHDQLLKLCERVCWRLRRRQVLARTVTLKIRYADFATHTRSRTISPTASDGVIFRCLLDLLHRNCQPQHKVRLLGVSLSKLIHPDRQLLLPFVTNGRSDASQAIDTVRDRFGFDAIHLGKAKGRR